MHASSFENMQRCFDTYIRGDFLESRSEVSVLDIGSADVNGTYRTIFSGPKVRYVGADMAEGRGVDLVLRDPYRLPLPDNSMDVVISGQVLEHCEFFWLSFQEMVRVLKDDGYLILIAPSSGPIHRYPVDCYRFHPDAYGALAKYVNCHLIDVWMDDRGPWRDLVGVFRKHFPLPPPVASTADAGAAEGPAPVDPPPGPPEAEVIKGAAPYMQVLERLHRELAPDAYLEIGVRLGKSLALAAPSCDAIGIDPEFDIQYPLGDHVRLFPGTSDLFFEKFEHELKRPPDLAFIDGMHLFEYALRDFMNVERHAHPNTLVVFDDICPNHPLQASRKRQTRVWTGDVWKIQACLRQFRPDLTLVLVDTHPSGLLLVAGLDPQNRVLWDQYNQITGAFAGPTELAVPPPVIERRDAIAPDSPAIDALLRVLKENRAHGTSVAETRRTLLQLGSA